MDIQAAQIATVTMEISIAAPRQKVWRALTADIGKWWPADFYTGGADNERDFLIETKPGGRMYEHWDSGGGLLWGTVVNVNPERSLQVLGHVFPDWGGPTEWFGSWTLEESGGTTTLKFSESAIGRLSTESMADKDKGWRFLWASLKAHIEGKPAPDWVD